MQTRYPSLRAHVLLLASIFSLATASGISAAPLYTFTDLGYVTPLGIDSAGDVLLSLGSGFSGAVFHSYGPQAGQLTSVAASGGSQQPFVTTMTSSGAILGWVPSGNTESAFVWSQGNQTVLSLPAGYSQAEPTWANASGAVVGNVWMAGGVIHGFLYQNGQMTDLGSLGGPSSDSTAQAINNSGQITGGAGLTPTSGHAFLDQNGKMTDLGTLGGPQSVGNAINDHSQVVGDSTLDANNTIQHAFLYSDGKMVDLGALGIGSLPAANLSEAVGINNSGTIVGDSAGRAVIWQNGSIMDLNNLLKNPPGFLLNYALGINDLGQIIGMSFAPGDGYAHGFLLTPTDLPAPAAFTPIAHPAPEPGSFAVFGVLALACFAGHRFHRRAAPSCGR